jgi:hypothetical protein
MKRPLPTPPRWEGDVTKDLLRMIITGQLVPNQEMARRLAFELLQVDSK